MKRRRSIRPSLVRLGRRVRGHVFGTPVPEEIDEEFAFHVEMRVREHLAQGMSMEGARAAAIRRFGDIDEVKAACRRLGQQRDVMMTWKTWWNELVHDLRFSFRQIRKHPVLALAAITTLGLGIGATTAVFTVVNGVILSPLPFEAPEDLVEVRMRYLPPSGFDIPRFPVSVAELVDYRDASDSYEALGIYALGARTVAGPDAEPVRVPTIFMDREALEALGVEPELGRWFTRDEDLPGTSIGLLGHDLWSTRFGEDPDIVGRTITVSDRPFVVTGVMPADFAMPSASYQLIENYGIDFEDLGNRASHGSYGIGRLKSGVTLDQLAAESRGIHATWEELYEHNVAHFPIFERLEDNLVGIDVRRALLVLLGAVGFVLLIAAVNVANLLVARGEARQAEVAVRNSLGASSGRIARQLATESFTLAAAGGLLGLIIGTGGLRALLAIDPTALPRAELIRLDGTVLAFAAAITAGTALVFGMVPALQSAGTPALALRGGTSTSGPRRRRFRRALVTAEVGLSLVVVLAAALVVRSFQGLVAVEPGVTLDGRLAANVALSGTRYAENDAALEYYRRVLRDAEALPGVRAVAAVSFLPLSGVRARWDFLIEGRPARMENDAILSAQFTAVLPGYFETMGIPPLRGRTLARTDVEGAEPVVVVSEDVVEEYFGGEDPIDQRVAVAGGDDPTFARVVGVVPRTRTNGLDSEVVPQIYYSLEQPDIAGLPRNLWFTLHTAVRPEEVVAPMRDVLRRADPALAMGRILPMPEVLQRSVAQPRLIANLIGAFALIALVLAAVGIYGVVSYAVTRRTREIGVRMALGAGRASVLGLMVREGVAPAALGVGIGVALALAASSALDALLFESSARDPAVIAAVSAGFLALALLSSGIPARRAARLAPTEALREE